MQLCQHELPLATVTEDDAEQDEEEQLNENEDLNENKDPTTSMKIVTASEKLSNLASELSFATPISIATIRLSSQLHGTNRAMQDGHQAPMKVFDKDGAKLFKPAAAQPIELRPVAINVSSPMYQQPLGPQRNEEVGYEAEFYS